MVVDFKIAGNFKIVDGSKLNKVEVIGFGEYNHTDDGAMVHL